jgi:AraC family transcriptional regulator, arabinose operon regulatory protein
MDWRVRCVIGRMQRNIDQPLTLASLAQGVNLSPSRLAHLFAEDTGISPGRFLRTLRLRRARVLVEQTSMSIKEVMASVGFNDLSHFVRDFAREHGHSPRRCRERARSVESRSSSSIRQQTAGSASRDEAEPPTSGFHTWEDDASRVIA